MCEDLLSQGIVGKGLNNFFPKKNKDELKSIRCTFNGHKTTNVDDFL